MDTKKVILIILTTLFLSINSLWAEQSTNNVDEKVSAGWTPMQISIWDNLRWLHAFPTNYNIYGMRLSMPWGGKDVNMYGIDFGGVAFSKRLMGIAFGGLAAGGNDVSGVALGGLAAGGDENVSGVAVGGLMAGSGRNFTGVALSGGMAMGEGVGVVFGGLMAGGGELTGAVFGGLVAGANKINGGMIGGLANFSGEVNGLQCAGLWNTAERVNGLQLACFNRAWSGCQFGLLNFNKSGFLPVCPVLNFDTATSTNLSEVPYLTDQAKWTALQFGVGSLNKKSSGSLYPEKTDVRGLQLCMPYSYNSNIFGLAIGIISTCEKLKGVQLGALGNAADIVNGLQIGSILNAADTVNGLQLALFNKCDSGFQLGLLNFNENGFLSVFPIVNFGWGDETKEKSKNKAKDKTKDNAAEK